MTPGPPGTWTVAAAVGFALVWVAIAFLPAPVTSADWAAWAQAVGTIAAVGLAAWVRRTPAYAASQAYGDGSVRDADRVRAAMAWLHRAAIDLELAISDGDLRRVRDGVAAIEANPAWNLLKRPRGRLSTAWPQHELGEAARETEQAVRALGQLLPEPEAGDDLQVWWHALEAAAARLRGATERALAPGAAL